MNRIEFTSKIVRLIQQMIDEGETPIIDFTKRSDEEQKRLYDKGLSKCDGYYKISQHQVGKAMDIYFVEDGKLVEPKKGFQFWHDRWVDFGGEPILDWDKNHFE